MYFWSFCCFTPKYMYSWSCNRAPINSLGISGIRFSGPTMSVVSVEPSVPCLDRNEAGCIAEISVFLKGGSIGADRLKDILPSLFVYFKIITSNEKASVLIKCGLTPYRNKSDVSFFFSKGDVRDRYRAPRGYAGFEWDKESHDGSSDSDEKGSAMEEEVTQSPLVPPLVGVSMSLILQAPFLEAKLDVADSGC